MTHQENHKVNGYCLCMCAECVTFSIEDVEATGDCHCPTGCACHRETPKLPAAYYPQAVQSVEHACAKCGTEVFRNGNRGRYPKHCPPCKEKLV